MRGGDRYGTRQERARKIGDLAYARLPVHRRRVDAALQVVERAAHLGRIGVSFSGGKDSTVLLDLVQRVQPDCATAFFDSGCEYEDTYAVIRHYGIRTIHPARSVLEMCRAGGYWGYTGPALEDPDLEFDFFRVLIEEPSRRFLAEENLQVLAMGLRAQESWERRNVRRTKGLLYYTKYDRVSHLCPLADWKTEDVWAYIRTHNLVYNAVYDRMIALGIPLESQRVACLLGIAGKGMEERYCYLRQLDPLAWARLVAEFPKIVRYT